VEEDNILRRLATVLPYPGLVGKAGAKVKALRHRKATAITARARKLSGIEWRRGHPPKTFKMKANEFQSNWITTSDFEFSGAAAAANPSCPLSLSSSPKRSRSSSHTCESPPTKLREVNDTRSTRPNSHPKAETSPIVKLPRPFERPDLTRKLAKVMVLRVRAAVLADSNEIFSPHVRRTV